MKPRTPSFRVVASALLVLGLLALALSLAACQTTTTPSDTQLSREAQQEASSRAFTAIPPYIPTEYTAREDINWYLQETEGRHTWYVYALSFTGEPLFYIVSDMKPRNICVSITAPDRVGGGTTGGWLLRSAPALDGVYYGGAACNAYYMRDAATGGFIELAGDTFSLVSSKTPLFLETDIRRLEPGK